MHAGKGIGISYIYSYIGRFINNYINSWSPVRVQPRKPYTKPAIQAGVTYR